MTEKNLFIKKKPNRPFIFIVLTWALVPEALKEGRATPPHTVACYIKVMIDLSWGLFPCHSWGLSFWRGVELQFFQHKEETVWRQNWRSWLKNKFENCKNHFHLNRRFGIYTAVCLTFMICRFLNRFLF